MAWRAAARSASLVRISLLQRKRKFSGTILYFNSGPFPQLLVLDCAEYRSRNALAALARVQRSLIPNPSPHLSSEMQLAGLCKGFSGIFSCPQEGQFLGLGQSTGHQPCTETEVLQGELHSLGVLAVRLGRRQLSAAAGQLLLQLPDLSLPESDARRCQPSWHDCLQDYPGAWDAGLPMHSGT